MEQNIPDKNKILAGIALYSDDYPFLRKILKVTWKLTETHEDHEK